VDQLDPAVCERGRIIRAAVILIREQDRHAELWFDTVLLREKGSNRGCP
jgi:hypothetical protein